jgi:DNA-binding transcriptional regulator PaaX
VRVTSSQNHHFFFLLQWLQPEDRSINNMPGNFLQSHIVNLDEQSQDSAVDQNQFSGPGPMNSSTMAVPIAIDAQIQFDAEDTRNEQSRNIHVIPDSDVIELKVRLISFVREA